MIEAATTHGTAAHSVPAHEYPATTRQVPQATVFLRALPASACAYHDLAVTAPLRPLGLARDRSAHTHEAISALVNRHVRGKAVLTIGAA